MEIIVGDVYSYISNPRKHLNALPLIREVCRARPDGYQFMKKYRKGRWDGYISLMHSFHEFPTGLLDPVVDYLRSKGYTVDLVQQERFPFSPVEPDFLNGITLRDYQIEAANELLSAGRGVAKMATNSGKTEVMAAIIKALNFPKTLVVLHRKELLHQTAQRFEDRLGIRVGKIGDNEWDLEDVTIAMVQTLSSRDGHWKFSDNNLLMIDECHLASSNQMLDAIRKIPGQYRFGFSGTPLKHDVLSDMKLISITGDIVYEIRNEFLIDEGYSAEPIVRIYTIEDHDKDNWELPYSEAYKKLIVENETRNNKISIIAEQAYARSKIVLILVSHIKHGKILFEKIHPEGTIFVNGRDTSAYRESVLDLMKKVHKGIFIASPIFDEGIDVPGVDMVILACGGKSHVKLLQRIGRGLRRKEGRNVLDVIDFIDDSNKYLLRHSEDRIDTYVDERFTTKLC